MKEKIKPKMKSYKMPLKHKVYLIVLVFAAAALIFALVKGPPKFEIPKESFTLIYTNNLQARLRVPLEMETVDSFVPADFTTLYMNLARLKTEAGNRNEPVLFFDGGNSLAGDEDTFSFPERNPMDRLLYEVPYSGMLLRESEYMTGISYLKKLSGKFAYLGLNVRNAKGKQAFVANAFRLLKAGDLKIAVMGCFIPLEDEKYPDFQFEKDVDFIKVVAGSVDADVKILLVSSPDVVKVAKNIKNIDIIIPSNYQPGLDFNKSVKIGENIVAPVVDSRFDIGKIRFVRQKAKEGSKKRHPWQITASVKTIDPTDEVPPGGILNVVLDARQNMDVKFRGKYRIIYDKLAFWSPDKYSKNDVMDVMRDAFLQYFNINAVVLDSEKVKIPKTQAWGTREILDIPGKPLYLSIIKANNEFVEKLKEKNKDKIYYYNSQAEKGRGEEKNPDATNEFYLLIDRDLIKDFAMGDLKDLQEYPIPANFILLDYFKGNRGKIYRELLGKKPGFSRALSYIDKRELYRAWQFMAKNKDLQKNIDALVYMGLAQFKGGYYKEALETWKKAQKIDPGNSGLQKILDLAPQTQKKAVRKEAGKNWSKFRGDNQNTARTQVEGPSSNLLKWKFEALDKIMSSPAVGKDGTIYIGAEDFFLYALKPTGELKWKYRTGLPIRSSPCIGDDGNIYVGSDDKNLYAFSPEGKKLWSYQGEGYFSSSPVVTKDGTVVAGCEDFNVYAVSGDGSLKWKFETKGVIFSSPALSKDGTIYIGSEDHYLYAIDSTTGKLKWKFETKHKVNASPAVGKDGTVYIGGEDKAFYAIKPDGTLKWKTQLDNYIVSSPAIAKDGTIYTGCEDENLYAISPDGKIKWKFKTKGEVISSPLVDGKGNIYVGSDDGNLYSVTSTGSKRWMFMARDPVMSSPALGPDGTLYAGSEDRNVYAIGE